jgi:putative salt-induced outer membrane protein YdiY
MEAAISKSFSLKTYFDDSYQNRPAPGKLKNDAKLVAALGYKF